MLYGFEEITQPLTDNEMSLVPSFVRGLSKKIGKTNAVTSSKIIKAYKEHRGIELTGSRVRKIINYIRMKNLVPCLIASSKGYYISNDKKELNNYIASLLGREKAIAEMRIKIEEDINGHA